MKKKKKEALTIGETVGGNGGGVVMNGAGRCLPFSWTWLPVESVLLTATAAAVVVCIFGLFH